MPYCSLEEAWGGSFTNEKKEKENDNMDIPFSNIDSEESEYMSIDYNESPISDKKVRDKLYSRNMSRLSNHSGPLNRYISHNKLDKLSYTNNIDKDRYPKKELGIESPPSYLNLDVPINNYDSELKNTLLSKQIHENDYNYNDILDEQYIKDNEKVINKGNFIKKNKNNNKKINGYESNEDNENESDSESENENDSNNINNNLLTSKKKYSDLDNILYKSYNDNDNEDKNMYDVVIYISTGIFIIFILDIFTKLGKNR